MNISLRIKQARTEKKVLVSNSSYDMPSKSLEIIMKFEGFHAAAKLKALSWV